MSNYLYPKTTGECVTVNHDGNIQLLDNALAELTKQKLQDLIADMYVGEMFWFTGLRDKRPYRTLVCDGSAVSRTQYAKLFSVIGTIYGAGDGSTTFNIPNLLDGGDAGNLGRFIRATGDDNQLGEKQEDTIRNITGKQSLAGQRFKIEEGAIEWQLAFVDTGRGASTIQDTEIGGIVFDANRGDAYYNPMAGHANGDDIHPYNIALLPLISY